MAESILKKGAQPAMAAGQSATVDWATMHEVQQFLYRQSDLLDEKRWPEFIDLFTDDGLYWMPPAPHYTTWEGQPSIFIEDRDLMTVRAKRITHPKAWSQAAEWGTNHVVSNVRIEEVKAGGAELHVYSRFYMIELRRDALRHFGGTYRHDLVRTDKGYRIKLQRVDMMNSQAPYDYVLQAWV
jgi:benzoate/toluate 1,2-dioxygenase subunit beta